MKSRQATGTVAAVLLLALGGCAASPAPAPGTAIGTSLGTAAGPVPSSCAQPTAGDSSTAQSQPAQPLTAAGAVTAVKIAETVIALYARPGITSQAWIDALDPYLSQAAAAAFEDTDPSTIPAHKVTGRAVVLATSTSAGALVDVPTDAGTYRVFLLGDGDGWLADQITPPRQG
jgi:hypothetical protein